MLWTTNIKCLVVEDDKFKLDDILNFLRRESSGRAEIYTCSASSTAMEQLSKENFNIAIIDMAIPSHPASEGEGSAYPLPKGGLDVLFEIEALGQRCVSIVLTQYPEVEIDGCLIPVEQAEAEIKEKFDMHIAGCIQYLEESGKWQDQIKKILEKNENTITGR
jgi:CheY-like chemotaxis protein